MLTKLFDPAIRLLQGVPSGAKNALLLFSAILLMIGFSLYSLNYGLTSTIYLDLLLLFLLLWVYLYIANMYSIKESISQLKETLYDVAQGKYSSRINELSASEFDLFFEEGNEMLRSLENKSTFLEEYKRVVDASSPLVKTDIDGHITYVNKAYEKLSGYSMDELLGQSHSLVRSEKTSDKHLETFWATILNKEVYKGEFQNVDSTGKIFYVESTVVPILDEKGQLYEFISIMFDITARKEQEQELERQLYIDTLTELPNRKALHRDIEHHDDYKLMLINVDDFNTVNTIYGESIGDELIIELAKKLQTMLSSDHLTLYRHSGDEFAILADEKVPADFFKEDTILMAHQFNPMDLQCASHAITVRARIGAAKSSKRGNPRSLVSMASLALREAKKSKQAYSFYSEDADHILHLEENLLTLEMLETALKHQKVMIHFQAIANTKMHEVEKFEALVRIVDEKGKTHYPNEFIAVAKGARLYSKLSKEIFRQTLEIAQKNPAYEFSYNIEMADILDPRTSRFILDKLRASNCAERIVFELVESEELEGSEQVYHFFKLIKEEGSKIAIDDFGSGYSNYAYLMKLGVDIVKIDGSLVADITSNLNNKRIVKSIINIMHDLGMKVVTEFVEDKETYQMVVLLGADYAQGHYIEKATGIDVKTLLER
jgi:PAS domain S-box-containing protein/diguanylate cyclase (GGDEF)-like protein